ncbi:hypothetical protein DBR06_SOUSAS1610315, partial [Sousa chinensis]
DLVLRGQPGAWGGGPGVVLAGVGPAAQAESPAEGSRSWVLLGNFPSSEAPGNSEGLGQPPPTRPTPRPPRVSSDQGWPVSLHKASFEAILKGLLSLHPRPTPQQTHTQRRPDTKLPLDYFIHMAWQDTGTPAKESGTDSPALTRSVARLPAL